MPEVHEATDVAALAAAVAAFVPRPTDGLSDAELMDEQRTLAEVRRRTARPLAAASSASRPGRILSSPPSTRTTSPEKSSST